MVAADSTRLDTPPELFLCADETVARARSGSLAVYTYRVYPNPVV